MVMGRDNMGCYRGKKKLLAMMNLLIFIHCGNDFTDTHRSKLIKLYLYNLGMCSLF